MRRKKPLDYILSLLSNSSTEKLGILLLNYYNQLMHNLMINQLSSLFSAINTNKEKIGPPQYFGKFRAFLFEEYILNRIRKHFESNKTLNFHWGYCINISEDYCTEIDILISRKSSGGPSDYVSSIECKVELDASRLKEALANLILIKARYPKILTFIVYYQSEVSEKLIDIAAKYVDGIIEVSSNHDFLDRLLQKLRKSLV